MIQRASVNVHGHLPGNGFIQLTEALALRLVPLACMGVPAGVEVFAFNFVPLSAEPTEDTLGKAHVGRGVFADAALGAAALCTPWGVWWPAQAVMPGFAQEGRAGGLGFATGLPVLVEPLLDAA